LTNCDILTLPIRELENMKFEFPDVYLELVEDAKIRLQENFDKMDEKVESIEIE